MNTPFLINAFQNYSNNARHLFHPLYLFENYLNCVGLAWRAAPDVVFDYLLAATENSGLLSQPFSYAIVSSRPELLFRSILKPSKDKVLRTKSFFNIFDVKQPFILRGVDEETFLKYCIPPILTPSI